MSTWKVVLIILGACAFIGIILGLVGRGFESPFLGSGNIGYVEVKGAIRNSRKVVEWIDKLSESSSIRAILVRIDSPGGGVAPSQEIYDALRRAREKGKPVVASAVGGIPLQVKNEFTGLLCYSVEGAAHDLKRLLTNPEYASWLARNGKEHVRQNFLVTNQLKDLLLMFLAISSPGKSSDVVYL